MAFGFFEARFAICRSQTLKRLFVLSLLFWPFSQVLATHIRGGYISAERISGYKYKFTLTIFIDQTAPSGVRNPDNDLYPDKNSSDKINSPNLPVISIPGKNTEIWRYEYEYTYRSPGVYTAFHYQQNRNENVLNMTGSVNTTFYVETKVIIDPFLDLNQTPIITKAAVDFAALGSVYRYNPSAYDPNGDSLSYQLVPSRQYLQGQEVSAVVTNYSDPAVRAGGLDSSGQVTATMTLNEKTGDLIWNSPRLVGEFNTAIKIVEWRKLRANRAKRDSIGFVLLDIQIIVKDSRNRRPLLKLPKDTCIVAGSILNARIFAIDPDSNDRVTISMLGELDTILPKNRRANFYFTPSLTKPFFGDFEWFTNCSHVRKQPYYAVFQAEDVPVISPSLVDVRVWNIKVVGPSPILDTVIIEGNGQLRLNWQKYICQNASKIFIYRKIDSSNIALDTCQPGMPNGNGFVKIAEVNASDITYLDDNAGKGLKRGPSYCYRIVAIFPDPAGGESLVSNEVCQALPLDIPVIVNVDITKTGFTDGDILVRWTQPFNIDTNIFKPPFNVQIFRSSVNESSVLVKSTFDLTDTTLVDSNLNTLNTIYNYQLKFIYGKLQELADSTEKSSSVRLELVPGIKSIKLQWTAKTAWTNDGLSHSIFRKLDGEFVLIDSVIGFGGQYEYLDEGQFNNVPLEDTIEYCYYIKTKGTYSNPNIASPLINASEILCGQPNDTIKPCPPTTFQMDTVNCEQCKTAPNCKNCAFLNQSEFSRKLTWHPVFLEDCGRDIGSFNIYFAEHIDEPLRLIATVTDTIYNHTSLTSLAGCYSVTSVDRSGNESIVANRMCVDNCIVFDLPNTITPNGDGLNEFFTPSCVSRALIGNVHLKIYNRWGQNVFNDDVPPEINWNGIMENNKTSVVPGVYFYVADIQAKRLNRDDEKMRYKGWIFIAK